MEVDRHEVVIRDNADILVLKREAKQVTDATREIKQRLQQECQTLNSLIYSYKNVEFYQQQLELDLEHCKSYNGLYTTLEYAQEMNVNAGHEEMLEFLADFLGVETMNRKIAVSVNAIAVSQTAKVKMKYFEETALIQQLPTRIDAFFINSTSLLLASGSSLSEFNVEMAPNNSSTGLIIDNGSSNASELMTSATQQQTLSLQRTLKSFSKKSVTQLEIVQELDLLFCISDGSLAVHDITTFQQLAVLTRNNTPAFIISPTIENVQKELNLTTPLTATAASRISRKLPKSSSAGGDEDGQQAMLSPNSYPNAPDGVPSLVTRVIVPVKKKLFIFRWVDNDYLDTLEFTIPDRVRSIACLGPYQLVFGGSRDYFIFDLSSGTCRTLFPIAGAISPNIPLTSLVTGSTITSSASSSTESTYSSHALVHKLTNDEVIVQKDVWTIFLGQNGIPTRKYGIHWSQCPDQIAIAFPYIVALFPQPHTKSSTLFSSSSSTIPSLNESSSPTTVEIRNFTTQTLIQQLSIDGARLLISHNGRIYIGTDYAVLTLVPISFGRQVDQLVESAQFDDAIGLLEQIDSIPIDEKSKRIRHVKTMKAVWLFFHGQMFEKSLSLCRELNFETLDILAAFCPELLPESVRKSLGLNSALAASSSPSKDLRKSKSGGILTSTDSPSKTSGQGSLTEISNSYWKSFTPSKASYEEIVHYLTDRRGQLLKQLSVAQSLSKSSNDSSMASSVAELEEELAVVDTTLLKAYLEANEALLGPLLRVQNRVMVDEAEEALVKSKKFSELVELYSGKGLHRRALQLLAKHAKQSNSPLHGAQPSVKYMQKLGLEHFELLMEFSAPLLASDPDEAMNIFINSDNVVAGSRSFSFRRTPLPKEQVFAHLEKVDIKLGIVYLEYVVSTLGDHTPDFHNRLATYYLEQVIELKEKKFLGFLKQVDEQDTRRRKLREFLEQSDYYRPERMMAKMPQDSLYEERAVLFHKMGQYDRAISIYLNQVDSFDMAVEYCEKLWSSKDQVVGRQAYSYLIRTYLVKNPNVTEMAYKDDRLYLMMEKHGGRIDLLSVLQIFPATAPISLILGYCQVYMEHLIQRLHVNKIMRNLTATTESQQLARKSQLEDVNIVIRDGTLCFVCKKRMGATNALVGLLVDGRRVPVHYSCKPNSSITKH